MPRITCPTCRTSGASESDSEGFETRGQWQGKAVRKCISCGAGMTVHLGLTGVKTRAIDAAQWEKMCEVWTTQGPGRPGADAERRNAVIDHLVQVGKLTEAQAEEQRARAS